MTVNACKRLESARLSHYPKRMECYDISNISGVDKVGSMVVFTDGEADKTAYRRFKIKTVEGADDFASLKEVLSRRLLKLGTDEEERFPNPAHRHRRRQGAALRSPCDLRTAGR